MTSENFTRRHTAALAAMPLAVLVGLLAASPASAQYYNTVGRGDPSVVVDMSVLDQLGPPANIGTVPGPDGLTKTPGPRRPAVYTDNPGRGEGSSPASHAPPPPAVQRGGRPGWPGRR